MKCFCIVSCFSFSQVFAVSMSKSHVHTRREIISECTSLTLKRIDILLLFHLGLSSPSASVIWVILKNTSGFEPSSETIDLSMWSRGLSNISLWLWCLCLGVIGYHFSLFYWSWCSLMSVYFKVHGDVSSLYHQLCQLYDPKVVYDPELVLYICCLSYFCFRESQWVVWGESIHTPSSFCLLLSLTITRLS